MQENDQIASIHCAALNAKIDAPLDFSTTALPYSRSDDNNRVTVNGLSVGVGALPPAPHHPNQGETLMKKLGFPLILCLLLTFFLPLPVLAADPIAILPSGDATGQTDADAL
jgi:hypothetical protein